VLVSYAHALREGAGEAGGTPAVPWDVAQGVRQRVAALPALAQELLALVAVLGREAPRRLLPLVAGKAEEAVVAALEAAGRARLLEETAQGYRFAHDVIAEVVEAELSGLRRRLLHRRVLVAWAQLERGEVAQAAELVAATLRRIREHQEPEQMLFPLRVQAIVLVRQGHWAAAVEALAEGLALAQAPRFPYPFLEAWFLHVWGSCTSTEENPRPRGSGWRQPGPSSSAWARAPSSPRWSRTWPP
jgi:hypothetical protein